MISSDVSPQQPLYAILKIPLKGGYLVENINPSVWGVTVTIKYPGGGIKRYSYSELANYVCVNQKTTASEVMLVYSSDPWDLWKIE